MNTRRTLITGIYSLLVAAVIILQFATYTIDHVNPTNDSIQLEAYDGTLATTEIEYVLGNPITELPTPEKVGYEFNGWFLNEELTDIVSPGSVLDEYVTLYAKYSPKLYQVNVYSEEGLVQEYQFEYQTEIDLSLSTQRVGYSFVAWYEDESLETEITNNLMPARDMNVYGKWIVNPYTLSVSYDGGLSIETTSVNYLDDLNLPESPTREGYRFAGWYLDSAYSLVLLDYTMPANDLTVYPKWIKNTYTVYLNESGGIPLEDLDVLYHDDVVLPAITKEGYRFVGWYTDDAFENLYTASEMPANDLTLYAKWEINQYTITYSLDGGNTLSSLTLDYQTLLDDLDDPVKVGHVFGGWYTDEAFTKAFISETMPSENVRLYANWLVDEYTLNFVDYDGTVIENYTFAFNASLSGVSLPSSLTKEGYEFIGWSGTLPTTMPANNLTFVAEYEVNKYTLSFLDHDGTVLYTSDFDYFEDLTNVVYPDNPLRTGYTFTGWDYSLPTTMPANNIVVNANYDVNSYFITFFDYDDTVLSTIEVVYGTDLSTIIEPETPSRIGYAFSSWNQLIPDTMPAENLLLKAVYTVVKHTVSFETNGGSYIEPLESQEGQAIFAPEDPTRQGYDFVGWYLAEDLLNEFEFITTPPADITIYAKWTPATYQVIYQDFNGELILSYDVLYGADLSTYDEPVNPSRIGYTFTGWDMVLPTSMPFNDLILIAEYSIDSYSIIFMDWDGSLIHSELKVFSEDISSYILPDDPSRVGYTFSGWSSILPSTMPGNNIEIYALYDVNEYTVSFNENGGTDVLDITEDYGTLISQPANPTRTGYSFIGWYLDSGFNNAYVFQTVKEDITLYAKWEINQYTIEFVTDGGTVIGDIVGDYQSPIVKPNDPIKDGYTFIGWDSLIPETMPANDLVITAQYQVNTYTLVYKDWDGTVLFSEDYSYGTGLDSSVIPVDPERLGYSFDGWSEMLPATMPSSDLIIIATYTIMSYDFEFIDWDGTVLQTETYTYGANLSGLNLPNDPTRIGYSFTGWLYLVPETMPANDVTNIAIYAVNQYTISFVENGGTNVLDITQDYGTQVNQPTSPTKQGYSFIGWFTDSELNNSYSFNTMEEDITLYAKWDELIFTIEFNTNGGSTVSSIVQDFGTDVNPPTDPTKTSYIFGGWYTDDVTFSNEYSFSTMPSQNITLYAKWNASDYTITFDSNGGTAVSSISQAHGTAVSEPADPTRVGYTFNGWYTDNNTFTQEYTFGTMPAENVTLYADWLVESYYIYFEENGGSAVLDIYQTYSSVVDKPTDPTRPGYIFNGWYTDDVTFNHPYSFSTMPAVDTTIYAEWIPNITTIAFNSFGGTNVSSIVQQEGLVVLTPAPPTKYGYTFDGWYEDYDLTVDYSFGTQPATDITLYAKWTAKIYTLEFIGFGGMIIDSTDYSYGTDLTALSYPLAPLVQGHTFVDWDAVIPTSMPNNHVTISAQYSVNQYTLEFVDWDGTVLQTEAYNYGFDLSAVTYPSDPTRVGYSFASWDDSLENYPTMPDSNILITAQYTIKVTTISFEENGGNDVADITQDYGTQVNQPANPTRVGYTFGGWFTDDVSFNNTYVFDTQPEDSITVYAKWDAIPYTIEIVDWDGTELYNATFIYEADLTGVSLPNSPSRTGYEFIGWSDVLPATMPSNNITITALYTISTYTLEFRDYDGSLLQTTDFNYEADLSGVIAPTVNSRIGYTFTGWDPLIPSVMPASNLTITAQYTINQYTITFVSNGGTVVADITQDYGTQVSIPTDPTRVGYSFDGWYSDEALTNSYSFTTMPANNITLYAAWTVNQYTITFDTNGGTAVNSITAQEGTALLAPEDPTKTGYYFGGWYTDNDTFNQAYTFITMPPANITLYARWLTAEEAAQAVVDEITQRVSDGIFTNLDVPNKRTGSMVAAINAVVNDLLIQYPGSSIELINGSRSGSTYVFTIVVTVDTATTTVVNITATFV